MRDRLLAFFDPGRSIVLFVVGTATFTLAITAVYDTAKEWFGLTGAWVLAGVFFVVSMAAMLGQLVGTRGDGSVGISEEQKPGRRAALVVLVSPQEATAPAAIEYHLRSLKTCWFIATDGSSHIAERLYETYRGQIDEIRWGAPYLVDPDEVADTYNVAIRIFEEEAPALNLASEELIADITGGQKPMTAGLVLACLARNRDMQYMKAKRNEKGDPDTSVPPEPVKIDTTFLPSRTITWG